ncbi:MAG: GNAT family N-acetyltransferase [Deltaproteobacteria bacterium]|nr:GNAT family N-acetyltransferase [Deltaproteobacteria bacterium]MCB9787247.1 GNAT family N-acetyltransferase [Deltaproteobacteria bacterium]
MKPALTVRAARSADIRAIEALMAPEVRAGKLLPRRVRAEDFLVACAGRRLVGAVGVSAVTGHTAELGSLVVARRGLGIGRALVEAAMAEASARGLDTVIALSDAPEFFERCGFERAADTPWLRARAAIGLGAAVALHTDADLGAASSARSQVCAACDRLAACRQSLLVRRTTVMARSHA